MILLPAVPFSSFNLVMVWIGCICACGNVKTHRKLNKEIPRVVSRLPTWTYGGERFGCMFCSSFCSSSRMKWRYSRIVIGRFLFHDVRVFIWIWHSFRSLLTLHQIVGSWVWPFESSSLLALNSGCKLLRWKSCCHILARGDMWSCCVSMSSYLSNAMIRFL